MQVKFLFGYYILKNHKSKFLSPEISWENKKLLDSVWDV